MPSEEIEDTALGVHCRCPMIRHADPGHDPTQPAAMNLQKGMSGLRIFFDVVMIWLVQPCSGREAYIQRYIAAFSTLPGAEKTKIVWVGNVHATLVAANGESWDDIAIVEYESVEAMRSIIDSAQYRAEAEPHRQAALLDWRFIATTKAEMPG